MNIDKGIASRAFCKVGEEPINETEWAEVSGRVRTLKDFYLAVVLESLASYDWTSCLRRKALELEPEEQNLTNFSYIYKLPSDCAKCKGLADNGDYITEGEYLYTDSANAVLIYVTSFFTGKYKYKKVDTPTSEEIDSYYTLDKSGEYVKADIGSYSATGTYYIVDEQDYNFYDDIKLEPLLSEYIELMLAASIALKLCEDSKKYQMLYSEAQIVANKAMNISSSQARNKAHGKKYWAEELGLSEED